MSDWEKELTQWKNERDAAAYSFDIEQFKAFADEFGKENR